ERSHHTDDAEFYALNLGRTTTKRTSFRMAQEWILTYNFRRPHFGRDMGGRTPMEVLLSLRKDVHPALGAFPVLLLDRVPPHLRSFRVHSMRLARISLLLSRVMPTLLRIGSEFL
ncbi:MAG: hypothetical protein ABIM21_00070, partial [candidate division WOR-3 bacterium]